MIIKKIIRCTRLTLLATLLSHIWAVHRPPILICAVSLKHKNDLISMIYFILYYIILYFIIISSVFADKNY